MAEKVLFVTSYFQRLDYSSWIYSGDSQSSTELMMMFVLKIENTIQFNAREKKNLQVLKRFLGLRALLFLFQGGVLKL